MQKALEKDGWAEQLLKSGLAFAVVCQREEETESVRGVVIRHRGEPLAWRYVMGG